MEAETMGMSASDLAEEEEAERKEEEKRREELEARKTEILRNTTVTEDVIPH